jgi:hypothetical protein
MVANGFLKRKIGVTPEVQRINYFMLRVLFYAEQLSACIAAFNRERIARLLLSSKAEG